MVDSAETQSGETHELRFFGKTLSTATHEYNNILSVISMATGLLNDMLDYAQQGQPLDHQRIRKQTERLIAQVTRGVTMTKALNMFAHSVDTLSTRLDLRVLAANMVELLQPRAARRDASLVLEPGVDSTMVTGNPFRLRVLIAEVLESALAVAEEGESVVLNIQDTLDSAQAIVTAMRFSYNLCDGDAATQAKQIGARLERGSDREGMQVWSILLPSEQKDEPQKENSDGQ